MPFIISRRAALMGGLSALVAPSAIRADPQAEIELILALDASASMRNTLNGQTHWDAQVWGHMMALQQSDIVANLIGRVFLRIIIWAGTCEKVDLIYDGLLESSENIEAAIRKLKKILGWRYMDGFGTNNYLSKCIATDHTRPIETAVRLLPMAARRILDISTDQAPGLADTKKIIHLRQQFEKTGGSVNALTVEMTEEARLVVSESICSPLGFIREVDTWSDYARAIGGKIATEIS